MFGDLADGAVREADCLGECHDITGFVTFAKGRSPAGVLRLSAEYFDLTGTIVEDADTGIAVLRQVQHISDAWLHDQGGSGPRCSRLTGAPLHSVLSGRRVVNVLIPMALESTPQRCSTHRNQGFR